MSVQFFWCLLLGAITAGCAAANEGVSGVVADAAPSGAPVQGGASDAAVDAEPSVPVQAGASGAAAAAGTGGVVSGAPARPSRTTSLCDGTTDIRVTYSDGGPGFQTLLFPFVTLPFGRTWFAIDGACGYYARGDAMQPTVHGTLTVEQANELMQDLDWSTVIDWGDRTAPIPDSGGVTLRLPDAALGCNRGCMDPEAKPIVDKMAAWLNRLSEEGEPSQGPISAIAIKKREPTAPDAEPPALWPVTTPIEAVPNLLRPHDEYPDPPYAVFTAEPDLTALRALRTARAMRFVDNIEVQSSEQSYYDLYLRDELPSDDSKAIEAFMNARNL